MEQREHVGDLGVVLEGLDQGALLRVRYHGKGIVIRALEKD